MPKDSASVHDMRENPTSRAQAWAAIGACLLAAIVAVFGAMSPWIMVDGRFNSVSRSGVAWDRSVSIAIMIIACAVALTRIGVLLPWQIPALYRYSGVVGGVGVIALSVYAGVQVANANSAAHAFPTPLSATVGIGIYLCGTAGLVLLIAAVAPAGRRMRLRVTV